LSEPERAARRAATFRLGIDRLEFDDGNPQ
jgi:hypothetical protein